MLTVGGLLGGLSIAAGAKMLWDPIGQKWFPDTTQTDAKFGALEPGADGIVRVPPELAEAYKNSLLDDQNPGKSASQYANELYQKQLRAKQKFDYDSPAAIAARTEKQKLEAWERAKYRDTLARQKAADEFARLKHTDNMLLARAEAQRANEAQLRLDQNAMFQLQTQRSQAENRHALAIAELMSNKDKSAWEQKMYEQQLGYDEEQRRRDQRKFYALLGQSILSEGVKAFF